MVMVPHEEGGWVWATSNFFTSEWHKVILLTFIFMQDLINISVR